MASQCYCNREGIKSWLRAAAAASAARPRSRSLAPLLTCCFSVSRSISKFSLEAGSVRRVEGSACAAPASHSAVDAGPKDDEIRRAVRTEGNPMDTGLKDLLARGWHPWVPSG